MSNYANLKSAIQSVIKTNGNNEITGQLLQNELLAMITTLGYGYQFMGIANPQTVPGTPDAKVFYLAYEAGTYTNFGGIVVTGFCVLKYATAWSKDDIPISGGGGGTDFTLQQDDLAFTGGTVPKLRFANRVNGVNIESGLDYFILREDISFEDQVTIGNSIYEIRYDFDLDNSQITIPNNSVLLFNGGKLLNGTVVFGSGCGIDAGPVKIFENVTLNNFEFVRAEWFGISTQSANNSPALVAAANGDERRKIIFPSGVFVFSTAISLPFCSLIGEKKNYATDDIDSHSTIFKFTGSGNFITISDQGVENRGVFVKDIAFRTEITATDELMDYTNYGKTCFTYGSGNGGCYFENVLIYGFETGLLLSSLLNSRFDQCLFYYCGTGVRFENLNIISTTTRFSDCYFHGNKTNFETGSNSIVDLHFIGCVFESSKIDNVVLHPNGLHIVNFDNCYCENCNRQSQEQKTYIVRVIDVDGSGNKLTGTYNFVIQSHGCNWFGSAYANPRFIYLPVGQFVSSGDFFSTFTKLVVIDDLYSINNANSCGVIFNSSFVNGVSIIEEINISSISKNKLHIIANSPGYGDYVITSRQTRIRNFQILEEPDYSGNRREISVNEANASDAISFTDDAIIVIGNKNRRLGEKYSAETARGFSGGMSFPTQTTQNVRPNGANGDQIFVRGLKIGGRPFMGMSGTLQSGDSIATAQWTNNIFLYNSYGTRPTPSSVSALTGFIHFETGNKRPIWWTSSAWVDALGNPADAAKSGTTAQRPTGIVPGYIYFDTTLAKPIWYDGTNWVDATGATV